MTEQADDEALMAISWITNEIVTLRLEQIKLIRQWAKDTERDEESLLAHFNQRTRELLDSFKVGF